MKALEKDRNRRYETASGFAAGRAALPGRRAGGGLSAVGGVSVPEVRAAAQGRAGGRWADVVRVVLLGGGGGWVARDRESRKERTVAEAKAAWTDVERLRRQGKWPAALSVARRTERRRPRRARPELGSKFSGVCGDLEWRPGSKRSVPTSQSINPAISTGPGWAPSLLRPSATTVSTSRLATAEAAEQIRGRTIPEELVAALDDWATMRWRTDKGGAWRLLACRRPGSRANRLREAFERGERPRL